MADDMTMRDSSSSVLTRFDAGFDAPEADVLSAVATDGICILENALSPQDTAALKDEIYRLAERPPAWLKDHGGRDGFTFSFSPVVATRQGGNDRLAELIKAFDAPLLEKVCRTLLGPMWYFDRIILELKPPSAEPITDWHADQFPNKGRCIKCMIYLGDTDADGGAFSYVPGSHHLMRAILDNHVGDHRGLRYIETIRSMARDLIASKPEIADELSGLLSDMELHIESALQSDDHYSVAAPAGSAIFFDAMGVHRGGVPRRRERLIVRSHGRNFQFSTVFNSRSEVTLMAQRMFLRATQGAGASLV
jgi:hypothetical protein